MKINWSTRYNTAMVYVIITFSICFVIAMLLVNLGAVGKGVAAFFSILMPFIVGFSLALLLVRPVAFFEYKVFGKLKKRRLARMLSILCVYVTGISLLALLLVFVLPQFAASLGVLFSNMPDYLDLLQTELLKFLDSLGLASEKTQTQVKQIFSSLDDATNVASQFLANAKTITTTVATWAFNIIVGGIVAAYALADREGFARKGKKLVYALFPITFSDRFFEVLHYSYDIFIKYILGTLVDALIVGTVTFLFLSIFGFPYPVLIAVIIGITNIIPFFGPLLGAIPSAIILFVAQPWSSLWFIIFIIALQQIDGNIILPRIVGQTTRLQSFWILVALILGGGLFGFWGLVLGVPVFAVIYSLASAAINKTLCRKKVRIK